MKCPKCGYLGFESRGRCLNCGYDFSLTPPETAALDLALQPDLEPLGPPPDLALAEAPEPFAAIPKGGGQRLDLDRIIGAPSEGRNRAEALSEGDLPLFGSLPAETARAIVSPSRPRAPLAVRRATPEIPRAKMRTERPPGAPNAAAALGSGQPAMLFEPPVAQLGIAADGADGRTVEGEAAAAPARRVLAALVDLLLLLAVDAAVLYLTLRLVGLTPADIRVLPLVPLVAFLMLLNGGYFVAFTAVGGQSIGKMAAGIKVISQEDCPVAFTGATLRTLGYVASALPLGAGFLLGLLGSEKRALHDRLARTRVVRPAGGTGLPPSLEASADRRSLRRRPVGGPP
jgi:uncharacterized RDD family membrane protein YckC